MLVKIANSECNFGELVSFPFNLRPLFRLEGSSVPETIRNSMIKSNFEFNLVNVYNDSSVSILFIAFGYIFCFFRASIFHLTAIFHPN